MTHFMQQYMRWQAAKQSATRHLQLVSKLKQLPQTARVVRALERSQARSRKMLLIEKQLLIAASAISGTAAYVHMGAGGSDLADLIEVNQDEADIAEACKAALESESLPLEEQDTEVLTCSAWSDWPEPIDLDDSTDPF